MNHSDEESLDRRLASISREVEPARDLWPGIEAQLLQRRPSRRPVWLALAAGIAGACLASALTWAVMHGHGGATQPSLAVRAPSFDEPNNPRYIAARASLESNFRDRLQMLDPQTRAHIEASLAVIRQAHDDIRKALTQNPESPVLEQLWQSTWRDELDLYDNVVQATEPTMLRI